MIYKETKMESKRKLKSFKYPLLNHFSHMTLFAFINVSAFVLIGSAFAFRLPDTGQGKCYNSDGIEIPCPPSGQDGAYAINTMSFSDNGNGTVTDNNTGLMWQKGDPNPQQYNWFQASGTYHSTHNPSTIDVCGSLSIDGLTDWRLPTKKELITIVDYSIPSPGPTINQSFFPYAAAHEYWTIDRGAQSADYAWLVQFSDGQIFAVQTYFTFGLAPANYVRCVRGATEPVSLKDNLDGTTNG
jgi:hypothetical protein